MDRGYPNGGKVMIRIALILVLLGGIAQAATPRVHVPPATRLLQERACRAKWLALVAAAKAPLNTSWPVYWHQCAGSAP